MEIVKNWLNANLVSLSTQKTTLLKLTATKFGQPIIDMRNLKKIKKFMSGTTEVIRDNREIFKVQLVPSSCVNVWIYIQKVIGGI